MYLLYLHQFGISRFALFLSVDLGIIDENSTKQGFLCKTKREDVRGHGRRNQMQLAFLEARISRFGRPIAGRSSDAVTRKLLRDVPDPVYKPRPLWTLPHPFSPFPPHHPLSPLPLSYVPPRRRRRSTPSPRRRPASTDRYVPLVPHATWASATLAHRCLQLLNVDHPRRHRQQSPQHRQLPCASLGLSPRAGFRSSHPPWVRIVVTHGAPFGNLIGNSFKIEDILARDDDNHFPPSWKPSVSHWSTLHSSLRRESLQADPLADINSSPSCKYLQHRQLPSTRTLKSQ